MGSFNDWWNSGGLANMGKAAPSYSAPPANWTTLAEYQATASLAEIRRQAELDSIRMQLEFQAKFEELQNAYTAPPAPEITQVEDIDWTDKIAEMEADARVDMAKMTDLGAASGTIITSPLIWDTEPAVLTKSLLAV